VLERGDVVVVTGGASGLGAATVTAAAARGAHVVVVDRQVEQAPEAATDVVCADVADEQAVAEAFRRAATRGPVRLVVHCAGIGWADRTIRPDGSLHPLAGFEKVVRVNLIGSFNVLRFGAQAISRAEADEDGVRGCVVLTASVAALDGQTGQVAYGASKGGVVAMTLPAARDLSPVGVRVNTIVPGLMETPLAGTMPDRNRQRLEEQALMPKRFGRPSEFAALAIHIADNPYLNAEVIRLDAGMRMPVK
jgi:NAD(P)-dependent dehydrogenase (short-subunit alcohol dehydrogenase family)